MNPQINILPEEFHAIENYLERLEAGEKGPMLEKSLQGIPNLEQKIVQVKNTRTEIEDAIKWSKIKEFHNHLPNTITAKESSASSALRLDSKFMWFSLAAVLVVLIGIFWMMNSNSDAERIFSQNFVPDVGLPLKMGTTDDYAFYEGMVDYKAENYKEAIIKWKALIRNNPENDTLNYFLGVSNLALGRATKSLEYLQDQERFQQSIFKEDAAYYAALAKIKAGEFDEAKVLLQNPPSPRNTKLLNIIVDR